MAVGLALTASLGACTGTDPAPEWTPATATPLAPTDPTPTPTTDPATTKPERPTAMNTPDAAGAEAAARYFMELYAYAFAVGDASALQDLSDAACTYCSSVVQDIAGQAAAGVRTVGGAIALGEAEAVEVSLGSLFTVRIRGQQEAWSVVDADGGTVDEQPAASAPYLFTFVITMVEGEWKVREVQLDALPE